MHTRLSPLDPRWHEAVQRGRLLMEGERSAVLALCHEGTPRCFQMAVALTPSGSTIFLATAPGSKLEIVRAFPSACLFFSTARNRDDDPNTAATLEVVGEARELDGPWATLARESLATRHPKLASFFARAVLLGLVPRQWIMTERFQEVTVVEFPAQGGEIPFAVERDLG